MALSLMPMRYSFDGKTLRSQTKYVIMNLWDYFEREAQKSGRVVNCTAKVAKATGKWLYVQTERTIGRIRAEYKEKGVFWTPKKRYARPCYRIDADDFDRDAICRLIHYHYKNRKNLTLKKILVRDGTL